MYNNPVITIKIKEAKNLKEKIIGLIGENENKALMLRTHFGIHTFGLKFPIDVLILNKKNEVVSMKENLAPNRIFLWNPIYEKVVELPKGTIGKKGISLRSSVRLLL